MVSMNREFLENLIMNKTEQIMFDSLDNIDDVTFLRNELKKQLRENKQLKEQLLEETKNNYKLQDELHKKAKEYQETYKDVREEIKGYKNQLKQRDEVIDDAINKLNNFIDDCKAEKIESGSDYLHHQYWDMFERFNKQIKKILQKYKGDNNE